MSFSRCRGGWKLFIVIVSLMLCFLQSTSSAMELGSPPPPFLLTNLSGNQVSLVSPAEDNLVFLYFFDASAEAIEVFARLNKAVSKSAGSLSLLAISGENPQKLREILADNIGLFSVVLSDDKGVTFAYGLSKKLPALVIIGPGGIVGDVMAPVSNVRDVLMASADILISLGLPIAARNVYLSIPADNSGDTELKLAIAYMSILAGNMDSARQALVPLAATESPFQREANAALGFLEFRQRKDDNALAKCALASGVGFADYIAGTVRARSGQCEASSMLFEKAVNGRFAFKWQEALALNLAAGGAEAGGDVKKALALYKKAFSLAPLNPILGANLLMYHWRRGNIPGASAYAETIESIDTEALLIKAMVSEFKSEVAFNRDKTRQRRLRRKLAADTPKTSAASGLQGGKPLAMVVSDIAIMDCLPEMNFLHLAVAGLLKQNLEGFGRVAAVKRPEILATAKHMGIARKELQSPIRMAEVARKLSVPLITFGELGNYNGEYMLNLRIADVFSGEIVAVTSERFGSYDELVPAIQHSGALLMQKWGHENNEG